MPEPTHALPTPAERDELLRAAARLLGSREAAEDAVQEALLRLVERARRAEPLPDAPGAWLGRVTRNVAIDRLRRRRLERDEARPDAARTAGGPETARADSPAPDDELQRRERCREAVAALLDGAGPRDAATVLLREVFGIGYADIAHASGQSDTTCRQRVHRALRRARERPRGRARLRRETDRVLAADAVLERFVHAVLDADPVPLFATLRGAPPEALERALENARTAAPSGPTARVRVSLDARGARAVLALGEVTLCELPRTSGVQGRYASTGSTFACCA